MRFTAMANIFLLEDDKILSKGISIALKKDEHNLLEEITLLIEALVEQQERMVFSEAEDTLTARLQHQLLKLRNILKAPVIL